MRSSITCSSTSSDETQLTAQGISKMKPTAEQYPAPASMSQCWAVLPKGEHYMVTEGCITQWRMHLDDPALPQQIAQAFAAAARLGATNLPLLQMLPFDCQQTAYFLLPAQVMTLDATELQDFLRRKIQLHSSDAYNTTISAHDTQERVNRDASITPLDDECTEQHQFYTQVQHAVTAIADGHLDKVVLSRTQRFMVPTFDLAACISRLQQQNPTAATFCMPLDDGSYWFGASPELLLARRGDTIRTQPLAGTCRRNPARQSHDQALGQGLLQSSKDRHEHQLVVQQIAAALNTCTDSLEIPSSPSLLATANLWHLASDIHARLREPSLSSHAILQRLHPTAAVCGHPTRQALTLIKQLEPFDRHYFCGAVGWQNHLGDGQWQLMIRCAKLAQQELQLFAGAGIVAASTPAAEWAETQAKLQTLRQALGLHSSTE